MTKVVFPDHPKLTDFGAKIHLLADNSRLDSNLWSLCNPSIGVDSDGNYSVVFRSANLVLDHPQYHLTITTGNLVKNRVYFADIEKDLKTFKNFFEVEIVNTPFPIDRGIEDMRLFWRDSSWWMTGVLYEPKYMGKSQLSLFKFDKTHKTAIFIEAYRSPTNSVIEKNWMLPYEKNPNFDFIYDCGKTIKNGKIVVDQKNIPSHFMFRGGSCLVDLGDKTYLSIVHRNYQAKYSWYQPESFGVLNGYIRNYTHCFVRYDWEGKIIQYTEPFQFISPGVEFASGMIKTDTDFVISFGKRDYKSYIASIPITTVLSLLKDYNESD